MPLILEFLGAVIRFALAGVFGWLVAKGVITADQASRFSAAMVASLAMGGATLLWSLWAKYKSRLKLTAALELPKGATEDDAKDKAATMPVAKAFTAP